RSEELLEYIKIPKWDRLFRIKDALMAGVSAKRICESTLIDKWFVQQIQLICDVEKEIALHTMDSLPENLLKKAKEMGFSDEQMIRIMGDGSEDEMYSKRK